MTQQRFCKGSCEHCGQHIEFPAEAEGLKVACPQCSKETVLVAAPWPADEPEGVTANELKTAFAGMVPPRRISVLYQAGLFVVAMFMLLLPLAYLAIAAAAAYGVYWYAIHAKPLFLRYSGSVHLMILMILVYISPIMAGSVAVFFMFKPLLARRARRPDPVELNPAQHPRVYQFIAHICDLLHAPMPSRIYLDCTLNAGAGLRRGWLSFFGNDLGLTLGLPLAAGLDIRQFAGVVSHELGHCTQAMAMRLRYVINTIDRWFIRVVYERDTWDEALDEWIESAEDWRASLIVGCVGLGVWASRKVLSLLMLSGHAASCFLSRQMEYHADACA
ncbi:MAG TPA: M48 family metallopeptidase, partial [Patescibacteria group bacterium]|nr:M48 family metallopeptidase [Patescibacteria group bacterium]